MRCSLWLSTIFLLSQGLGGCSDGGGGGGASTCNMGAQGGANFTEHLIDRKFVHGQHMELVDIDQSGTMDILVAFSLTDSVHLYLNLCDSWKLVKIAPAGTLVATGVASGDFDGDGDLDVAAAEVFGRTDGEGSMRWYENSGTATDPWTEHVISTTIEGPHTVKVADMSGDGLPDLVVGTGNYGDGVQWFHNTGGAFEGPLEIDGQPENIENLVVHDVDADGVLDVVTASVDDGEIAWYESDRGDQPSGTIAFTKHIIDTVASPYGVAMGNLDDDAELELVASGARGIEVYDPPALPTEAWTSSSVTSQFAGEEVFLVVADLDGDQNDDVALVSSGSAVARAYLRTGSSYTERVIADNYAGFNGLVSGDLDGDGDIDLLTSTYANGDTDRISWWQND